MLFTCLKMFVSSVFWLLLLRTNLVSFVSCEKRQISPTRPPPNVNKFVSFCEVFCDGEFDKTQKAVHMKSIKACHKGCYSYELFRVISGKKSIAPVENICKANCDKDFEATYKCKFCKMGCTEMGKIYMRKSKAMIQARIAAQKVHKQDLEPQERLEDREREEPKEGDRVFDEKTGKFVPRRDKKPDEFGLAVIVNNEKERSVRLLKSGHVKHKARFQIENVVDNASALREILKLDDRVETTTTLAQKILSQNPKYGAFDSLYLEGLSHRTFLHENTMILRRPSDLNQTTLQYFISQIPVYLLLLFACSLMGLVLYAVTRDPDDCWLPCLPKLTDATADYFNSFFDTDDEEEWKEKDPQMIKVPLDEYFSLNDPLEHDYTCPPPDQDAPPPYASEPIIYEKK